MTKPKSNRARLESVSACGEALDNALDLIMAVQAAGLRGVLVSDRNSVASELALASKIAEARAAVNAAVVTLWSVYSEVK